MIVIAIIAIIAAIAIPNLRDARIAAWDAQAIATLRAIHSAQNIYREQDIDGNGTLDYSNSPYDLTQLGLLPKYDKTGHIDDTYREFGTGSYRFGASSSTQFTWSMWAYPQNAAGTYPSNWGEIYPDGPQAGQGWRRFWIAESGVIRYTVEFSSNGFLTNTFWPAIGK